MCPRISQQFERAQIKNLKEKIELLLDNLQRAEEENRSLKEMVKILDVSVKRLRFKATQDILAILAETED